MEHTDLELMDLMMKYLYDEVEPQVANKNNFLKDAIDVSDEQFKRVKRLVLTAGIIEELEENQFTMTAKGLELMIKFGCYSEYLKELGQDRKKDLLMWKITISVGVATILVALVNLITFFLGLCE